MVGRALRVTLAVSVCTAVTVSLMGQIASADDLTDRRDAVKQQLAKTRSDLSESSAALSEAAVAVDRTEIELGNARAQLAQTRVELAAAARQDRELAAKLRRARAQLAKVKAAVLEGQKKLDAEEGMAGNMVRDQYQQQTNLLPIAVLVESSSTADLQTRLQWSTTMFDSTAAQIDRLTTLQRRLNAKRARQTELERQIAADRAVAAANLRTGERLERQAAREEANVASLLATRQQAKSAAASEVAADKKRYAELNAERSRVEQRIAERIAKAKAEAARRAAAARAARIAAAKAAAAERARARAERRAERERARQQASEESASRKQRAAKRKKPSSSSSGSGSASSSSSSRRASASSSSGSNAAHGFSYPVSAAITSPYGMRLHPVLGYWKLHDGTDFGAGCGARLRAPYSGRVVERYYNAGYGNRLMIDHGEVDGRYVTTGYNHAMRYTVGVGDWVDKGEVIGYVGTTGYSTGCHLHLMVWLDGKVRNPMTWF